jgi:DNA mismatch repair protein MLH1
MHCIFFFSCYCFVHVIFSPAGWTAEDGAKEDIAAFITQLLVERREMLQEYYRLTIDADGQLHSLPQIIPNYKPDIAALATFVLR